MSNILILGLGYVGWEIARLYRNNNNHNVLIVDSQFYPDRVAQMKKWEIKYQQKDIFSTQNLVNSADLIYNTVSITNVPQTENQSNPEIDSLIEKVGTEGNRYVISHTRKDAKIIFLSTHVIFEGYDNVFNIEEDQKPLPLLAYGRSKFQSESDIINSGKNFIIGRLGSTYGYNPAIRWKIVSNLFAKMATIDKKIKVFNKNGYKPIAGTRDVARALKYLAENYNKETYHLVNENKKVLELAEICKQNSLDLNIEIVIDDNPGFGYTLSNFKLLDTGFCFEQNVENEIQKMIKIWG